MAPRNIFTWLGLLALVLLSGGVAEAQTLREYQRAATKRLAEGDSVGALGIYRQAFDGVTQVLDAQARYDMARLAEGLRYYSVAKEQYGVIAGSDGADRFADLRFRLAEAQRRTGAYEAAVSNYGIAIAGAKDSVARAAAAEGLAATEWALSRVTRMDSVEVIQLPGTINTDNSELAGVAYDGRFYFSRLELVDYGDRDAGTRSSVSVVGDPLTDSLATVLPLETGQYVAHYALDRDRQRVFYTVCEHVGVADFRCDLYVADVSRDDLGLEPVVGTAKKLEAPLNLPGFTQTNPTVGRDAVSGDDLLIFASDRKGGEGKMDLWMSRIGRDGRPGTPENLGFANTADDDITPFFHDASQALFFSSRGHETLGGYDIHRIGYEAGNWGEVVGLRAPVNSPYDDTYYSLSDSPARTYLSSNRPGATCAETEIKECCGFDLYAVELIIALEVLTFDELDSTELAQTTVVLFDRESGAELSRFTGDSNRVEFPVDLGRDYRLVASRPDYGNDTVDFDTREIYQPTLLRQEMYLPPMLKIEIYTYNAINRLPLNGVRVEFAELGSSDTTSSYEPTAHLYTYAGEFGRSYRARGTRAGFMPDVTVVSTADFRGPGRIVRDTLYLAPFSPLPLVLYFDNDQPNPNTREPSTTLTYGETVGPYLAKESEFLSRGALAGPSSRSDMVNFFDEIRGNYERLVEFSGTLVKYLQEGNEIDIIIEGYASPLAQGDYNKMLTSRRTRSLINHFTQWESGALLPFLRTGQLRIRQEPLGESESPKDISDNPARRQESVYGLRASKQRKVHLIDIQRRDELPLAPVAPVRPTRDPESNSR